MDEVSWLVWGVACVAGIGALSGAAAGFVTALAMLRAERRLLRSWPTFLAADRRASEAAARRFNQRWGGAS